MQKVGIQVKGFRDAQSERSFLGAWQILRGCQLIPTKDHSVWGSWFGVQGLDSESLQAVHREAKPGRVAGNEVEGFRVSGLRVECVAIFTLNPGPQTIILKDTLYKVLKQDER